MQRQNVTNDARPATPARTSWRRSIRPALAVLCVIVAAVVLHGDRGGAPAPRYSASPAIRRASPVAVARTPTPEEAAILLDTAVRAIPPQDAAAINAARPLDLRRLIPAAAFALPLLPETAVGNSAALECMTKAIYYEAASESDRGERAVAQVVLNRMRSPIFPHTVCGVVFQGSERSTGCQFSFTCDGSLRRRPSGAGWQRARRIAAAALGGWVEPSVGLATHYHANYVVPYWADSLDKAATIGAHIFYVMRGGLGGRAGFREAYAATAEGGAPQGPFDTIVAGEDAALSTPDAAIVPKDRTDVREDTLGTLVEGQAITTPGTTTLRADETGGKLAVDDRKGRLVSDR